MRQSADQPVSHSKANLRRQLRCERSKLSPPLRAELDEAIGQHVMQLVKSRNAVRIACYCSFNGEPDLTAVFRQLMADGCELALPVISESNDHLMTFHSWQAETSLGKNRYGIFEPLETADVPVSSLDIILMPLVGYDRFGNRLGMGAGYYDRCLENLRDQVKPLRTGVAYGLQEISPVDKNIWDISLHGVVNEHGWFTFVS